MGSLTGREGAYVRSPVTGGTTVDSISGGNYTTGPFKGTTALDTSSNKSGYTVTAPVGNNPLGAMTEKEALDKGIDVNQLRREGRLVEGGGGDGNIAAAAYNARVNAAKNNLRAIQDFIGKQIGQAKGIRDEFAGKIATTYGNLKGEAREKLAQIQAALSEEDRGVVRDYETTQGGINRAAQNTMGSNRALARALGIGNSSFYMNKQDQAKTGLLDKTAALGNEKTAKLSGIKQRGTEATSWEARKQLELDQEKATLEGENERRYQEAVAKAQLDERLFGIDSAEQIEQAGLLYQQNANEINKYIATQGGLGGALSGASGAQTGAISSEKAVNDTLGGILAQNSGIEEAAVPFSGIQGSEGYANPITRALIDRKKKPEDQYLYA